ncbi:MAG: hypothetical protein A2V66_08525 [Ignavibacteria bacterium RBG_13_36_8]|nr:MAG: hypothetical protein A2V66_08525 [Ignavibacteria bacterium RBG_13_36_8]
MITLAAIIFATFLAISMRGIQVGTYAVNIKNSVEMFSGYLQIQRSEYQTNPSLNKCFRFNSEMKEALESTEHVIAYAPRVNADGLISFNDISLGTAIFGIDPDMERHTTKIIDKIHEGKFFTSPSDYEIVVGYKLLENLKAKIGDEIVILAQGYDGSLGNLKFKIVGTFKMGSLDFDAMGVYMGIDAAEDLLALYGNIHAVAISVDDIYNIDLVKEELNKKINTENINALTWEEVLPDLKQLIEMDNVSGIIMLLILIIIVTFGILNTVLMSVTERFNEFGVTLSIGMPQVKLVILILIETTFLTVLGIIIGDIIGWGINYYIVQNPIEFTGEFADMYAEYGFLPLIESSLQSSIFINVSLSILVISILSCSYPLYKVFKLEPLKGIRYT